jgi:DNA-binding HxlR family transcriptional regulator
MLETILGCKWSLTVYSLLGDGVNRPGAMERAVEGLSAKVLNACLRRNVELGILKKVSFPDIPPRVEYRFTPVGRRFQKVLAAVAALQAELE